MMFPWCFHGYYIQGYILTSLYRSDRLDHCTDQTDQIAVQIAVQITQTRSLYRSDIPDHCTDQTDQIVVRITQTRPLYRSDRPDRCTDHTYQITAVHTGITQTRSLYKSHRSFSRMDLHDLHKFPPAGGGEGVIYKI